MQHTTGYVNMNIRYPCGLSPRGLCEMTTKCHRIRAYQVVSELLVKVIKFCLKILDTSKHDVPFSF